MIKWPKNGLTTTLKMFEGLYRYIIGTIVTKRRILYGLKRTLYPSQ